MTKINTDVDIDVFNRERILDDFECINARIDRETSKTEKHPTGVYFQNIPRDAKTNIASLDYKDAAEFGFFKVDFLNVNMYEGVRNEAHLITLIERQPSWEFFQYAEITDKLFQLNGHSSLLQRLKPTNEEELAMILAIIRPSKAHLRNASWDEIKKDVWEKGDNDGYQFKRCHGIAYALAIIVNLNLMIEQLSSGLSQLSL